MGGGVLLYLFSVLNATVGGWPYSGTMCLWKLNMQILLYWVDIVTHFYFITQALVYPWNGTIRRDSVHISAPFAQKTSFLVVDGNQSRLLHL